MNIFKTFLNDINIDKNDNFYLIILLVFSLALTGYMISFHQTRGAFNSDIFTYLTSALDFSGLNYNHITDPSWFQNSPVILYFTSLLFQFGFIDITSIFVVTGIFGIFGIFGMYVFLKIRFSSLLSFIGTILYSSLSLTLYYFANGMLDVPAVSMIVWTLIFTVAAVDKNHKYFVLVAISCVLSFFTRFATAYILSLIGLYILKKYDVINGLILLIKDKNKLKTEILSFIKSKDLKWIIISSVIGIILTLYILNVLLSYYPCTGYLNMAISSINHFSNIYDSNYVPDKLFYLKNFIKLLSSQSITLNVLFIEKFNNPTILAYLIVFILIFGLIIKGLNFLLNLNFYKTNSKSENCIMSKINKILLIFVILLFIISIFGFKINYLITLFCLWLIFIILLHIVKDYPINYDNFSLSVICFALFSFYFIVVSYIDLKCVRYLLPAFPGFIYFVVLSLENIINFINNGFEDEDVLIKKVNNVKLNLNSNNNKLSKVLIILLIFTCLFHVCIFTSNVEINDDALYIVELCDFIKDYDSDYQIKDIFYSQWDFRDFEWYLNCNLNRLGEDFNDWDINSYDYVITFEEPINDVNFKEIFHKGNYYLYEKIS